MHYTDSIRSSNKRHQVGDRHAVISGRCKVYTTCVMSTSWTLHPLPENLPDLHGLEKWPLSRRKKTEFRSNTEHFHPCNQG